MPVPIESRIKYHPNPEMARANSITTKSGRRVHARLQAIMANLDFTGKSVLDLGCSGGFFGFATSDRASQYLGVDADEVLIARNTESASRLALTNVVFEKADITPFFIRSLPHFNIGLFLSVYHHILAGSDAYEWNKNHANNPNDIIRALAERVDVLVFETGYPDEGFEWCERLPEMKPTPNQWIMNLLHESGFSTVKILEPPTYTGLLGKLMIFVSQVTTKNTMGCGLVISALNRVFNIDPRDRRNLFIADRYTG